MLTYTRYFVAGSQGIADAVTLAGSLPAAQMSAFLSLDSAADSALLSASSDIDNAMRYQGRKIDPINQENQFPRLAYYSSSRAAWLSGGFAYQWGGEGCGDDVWDLDTSVTPPVPKVPDDVLAAVLYQANWIASGKDQSLDDQHRGVRDSRAGSVSRSYDLSAKALATGLCRRAYQKVIKYQLGTGRMQ